MLSSFIFVSSNRTVALLNARIFAVLSAVCILVMFTSFKVVNNSFSCPKI